MSEKLFHAYFTENEEELKVILKEDPFSAKNIAEYEIIEFSPTKYAEGFDKFINE